MIAPQMRKAKKERKFLTDLKTGDRVVMKSGMHGRVNHINQKEGTCIIETTAGKLKFNNQYRHRVDSKVFSNYLSVNLASIGAGEGIRTLDFNLGKVALYP